jgi:hypothetical protein
MTGTSIADPLAQSYISVVHRLLDELTRVAELTAENAELKVKLAARDAHTVNVAEVMAAARITDEDLEAEAELFDLLAFPAPFPNRFPIWDAWSDVPDGVSYTGVEDGGLNFRNYEGVRWTLNFSDGTTSHVSDSDDDVMAELAPFVEVK